MLTIRKIQSTQAGDYATYLTGRADVERDARLEQQGDYYTGSDGGGDAGGTWRGDDTTLDALGVAADAPVTRDELALALRGLRADTGERLRRPGPNGIVNSHDLTMGAPKSLSVLWTQSSPEERAAIELAMSEAAEATVRYMAFTTECVQRRDAAGSRVWEGADGVAAAMFVHHTARRPSEADVPDPHLHVHCVVVAVERADGAVVTPNQAAWMRHGREGGAYFRTELAHRLIDLGLPIESGTGKQGRYFEIEGISPELCERFSGRSREVESAYAAFVSRYGRLPRDGELSDLAAKSRERKGPETVAEIEPYWRAMAAEHGLDRHRARGIWRYRANHLDPADAREFVEEPLLERIEQRGATVRTREARAIALEAAAGFMSAEETMRLLAGLQDCGQLVALSDDRVTMRATRAQEHYCVDTVAAIAATPTAGIGDGAVDGAIARAAGIVGALLTDEQVAAVDALTSKVRVAGLVGRAGTGKGVALHAASAAYVEEGWQVLACATQGARAQGLAAQVAGPAMTINQLVHRERTGRLSLDARTVVFVDEAGMVDTHRMAELLHLTERTGCSLRLVGDPAQLAAIGPGGLLPTLLALDQVPTAELEQIHRTPHQWLRDVQNLVRDGRAEEALALLGAHDARHMLETQPEAMQRMVDDWDQWRHEHAPGDTLLVVHTTNADVDTVNTLAQVKRIHAGELGANSVPAPDREYRLHLGDRVMFRERAYYLDTPGVPRIENGTRGTITGIDSAAGRVRVLLDEPGRTQARTVDVDLAACAALRLDYASHVYPAQGDTRARTAELTGGPSVSRESAYVGGSRLRERHDLYTSREALGTAGTDADRWDRLAEQINTSRAQLPSIAYAQHPSRKIESEPPGPARDADFEKLRELESQMQAAKERLTELEREFPAREAERLAYLAGEKERTQEAVHAAEARIGRVQSTLNEVRPWQREQIKAARREIVQAVDARTRWMQRLQNTRSEIARIEASPRNPERWHETHGADLESRRRAVAAATWARDSQLERIVDRNIESPSRAVRDLLRPAPDHEKAREAWRDAVRAIESFRARHSSENPRRGRDDMLFGKDTLERREVLRKIHRTHSLNPELRRAHPRGLGR